MALRSQFCASGIQADMVKPNLKATVYIHVHMFYNTAYQGPILTFCNTCLKHVYISYYLLLCLQEMVPAYLATSPIISEGSALMQAQMGKGLSRLSESGNGTSIQTLGPMQGPGDSSIMKKRRKRRRKSKVDSMKREDNEDFSEDEDMFTIDMSSDDDIEASGSRSEQTV